MGGMHVNLLIESQLPLIADDLAAAAMIPGAETWAKTVPASDLRNIAAYINKRSGMPLRIDYAGNLYGTWGTWRSLRQVAQQQRVAPLLAGAALEYELHRLGVSGSPPPASTLPLKNPEQKPDLTRDQYRALAVDNLPNLRRLLSP